MIWLIIILSGLMTFAMRFVFLTPVMPAKLSPAASTAMRLVPIAVLWTIVVAELFLSAGQIAEFATNPRIFAAAIAAIIAWRTRSAVLTIACGMPLLWAFDYMIG